MDRILALIVGRLRWLLVGVTGVGIVLTYIGWTEAAHIRDVEANGVEALAKINSAARTRGRRGGETISLKLTWRDAKGNAHTADNVSISREYAARIIRGATIVAVDTIRIKYVPGAPDTAPIVLDDAARQEEGDRRVLTVGLVLAAGGALTTLLMFLIPRLRRRGMEAQA